MLGQWGQLAQKTFFKLGCLSTLRYVSSTILLRLFFFNTDLSCSNILEFISPLAKCLVALSNSMCFMSCLPGNVHLLLNRYVVHLFWKSILFPLLLFFVLRGLQFNWVTYTAFGNAFIYLCSVSSKDLQVMLELQHDEENFITEHLETFFFFHSVKFWIWYRCWKFHCVDQKMPNLREADCI